MRILASIACLLLLTPATAWAGDQAPLEVVPSLDLERYTGKWYEIARLPNRFQDDCAGDVTAEYALREDGRLDVVNACRQEDGRRQAAAGVARVADDDGPRAKLKVRFAPRWLSWLPLVWGDYWVIELDADYRYAVVGTPDRKYLWILSRTPRMDEATYDGIVERAGRAGFEVSRLVRTEQSPSPG